MTYSTIMIISLTVLGVSISSIYQLIKQGFDLEADSYKYELPTFLFTASFWTIIITTAFKFIL